MKKIQFILILFYIFGFGQYNEKTKLKLNNQNFYVELNSNFIKYKFSETELDNFKKNRINIPSNFFYYKGDLKNDFISVSCWYTKEDFAYSNSEFKTLLSDKSNRDILEEDLKKAIPFNQNISYKTINSLLLIKVEYVNTYNEKINNYYLLDNGTRYTFFFKFSDNKKWENETYEIINTLTRN